MPGQVRGDALDPRRKTGTRRVGARELVSLDGVMESPEERAFSCADDETDEASASGMGAPVAPLLGRVTYEHLAAYGPHQPGGDPMVDFPKRDPKYVVSGTPGAPPGWNDSTIIGGDVAEEMARLKRQPGEDITILGRGELVRSLVDLPGGVRSGLEAAKADLGAARAPEGVDAGVASRIGRAIEESFVAGFRAAMLVCAGLAPASAPAAALLTRDEEARFADAGPRPSH